MSMQLYKRYVDVISMQTKEGETKPLYICWENGRKYHIDRILSTEQRASQVGGCGMRYVCRIQGRERNLFLEKNRWFIESWRP